MLVVKHLLAPSPPLYFILLPPPPSPPSPPPPSLLPPPNSPPPLALFLLPLSHLIYPVVPAPPTSDIFIQSASHSNEHSLVVEMGDRLWWTMYGVLVMKRNYWTANLTPWRLTATTEKMPVFVATMVRTEHMPTHTLVFTHQTYMYCTCTYNTDDILLTYSCISIYNYVRSMCAHWKGL